MLNNEAHEKIRGTEIDSVAVVIEEILKNHSSSPMPLLPFVKWVGSKRKLIPQILPYVPSQYNRYIEPFLGSGALFLALQPIDAVINDACVPLINTWEAVRTDPIGVHKEATSRPLNKEAFYEARAEDGGSLVERAGRFIYLNKGAFNGLYRVNLKGEFNVPWGAPKSQFICEIENLKRVAALLEHSDIKITNGDFEATLEEASSGDFAFIDPPYVTSHNNNGFIEYNEKIFSWEDQVRLSVAARNAVNRGVKVLVTNANHNQVLDLYFDFRMVVLERASTLAASREKRGRTSELLLVGGTT